MKDKSAISGITENLVSDKKFPSVMYGLDGIRELFGVGKTQAWKLKETVIKDAVVQRGKVIIIDTRKALMLFGMKQEDCSRLVAGVENQ